MMDIIEKGGVLMYPILFLSIVSLAVFLERVFTLRKSRLIPDNFVKNIKELLIQKKFDAALMLCAQTDNPVSKIFSVIIKNREIGWQRQLQLSEEAGRREGEFLNRYQETMASIVALAPLLGLLGTVLGMIRIFSVLSGGGAGDAQALSGGISEALLTTAAGLSVAIPAQIFLHFIKYRADTIIKDMEKESSEIAELTIGR